MPSKIHAAGIGSAASVAAGLILNSTTLVLAISGTSAYAQDGPDDVFIEEVIVTATRRAESVQDIPVAVTAITGANLEESRAYDVYMMQEQAPGLVVSRSQQSTTASFAIRGIGTSSQNFGLESSVGLYVDGVFRSRQSAIVNNLVDVDRVEVMRGPQGTLFGKNTPSGAIQIHTVSPVDSNGMAASEVNAFVEVTGGDFGLVDVRAASNIPLSPGVAALRATLFSAKRDGYVNEVTAGSDVINDMDRLGGRLQLVVTPNDRLTLRAIADYAEIDEVCCAALTRQDSLFAFGRTGPGGTPIPGTDAILNLMGGTTFTGDQFGDRMMALNQLPRSTNEDRGLSLEINYDFDNGTRLTSISAYRAFDTTDDIDADFSDVALFVKENNSKQNSFSQEFRFDGRFGERTRYVAGVYYFQQDLDSDSTLFGEPGFSTYFLGDYIFNPDPVMFPPASQQGQIALIVDLIAAATAGVPPPPIGPGPLPGTAMPFALGTFANEVMMQEHRSWAVFAQFDFDLSDAWMLTAGVRYTDEKKDLTGTFTQNPLGTPVDPVALATESALFLANPLAYNPYTPESLAAFGPVRQAGWGSYLLDVLRPRPDVQESINDDQVQGTVKLSWIASDEVMLYASYGTGYKSGGTNTDRINALFSYTFGPETSRSAEIGMKSTIAGGRVRLNVAAHKTDVDDLQANSFTGLGFNLQNAGKAETHGAEVELLWTPLDNLVVQGAYTWSVADFKEFAEGTCWVATPFHTGVDDPGRQDPADPFCSRAGDRLPSNPEHNVFLAGTLDFAVGGTTNLFIRPEFNYYSDTMTDGNNEPLKLRDSYTVWNLSAGLNFESIQADLIVWGRNITSEDHYETVFDVPIQDGKLNAYPRESRTYGVTFRKGF